MHRLSLRKAKPNAKTKLGPHALSEVQCARGPAIDDKDRTPKYRRPISILLEPTCINGGTNATAAIQP